jgi:Cu-Zn family superoxide dismutase
VSAAVALTVGCAASQPDDSDRVSLMTETFGEPDATATARVVGIPGTGAEGRVRFAQHGTVVVVRGSFFGLPRNGEFGLHVHEKANCRSADGSAAGGHLNPTSAPHGRPGRGEHHAGDLPNLIADGEGYAVYVHETKALTVTEGPASVIGRSLILSRDRDDYRTQPDGNSGPPLACGLIRPE